MVHWLLKGAWYVKLMDGALVLVGRCMGGCMVKGGWFSCILQSASGRFLSESKGLPDPMQVAGDGPQYLAAQKVKCIVLPPNMDGSSFAHHHTWHASRA